MENKREVIAEDGKTICVLYMWLGRARCPSRLMIATVLFSHVLDSTTLYDYHHHHPCVLSSALPPWRQTTFNKILSTLISCLNEVMRLGSQQARAGRLDQASTSPMPTGY
jgi:hypothetical protein